MSIGAWKFLSDNASTLCYNLAISFQLAYTHSGFKHDRGFSMNQNSSMLNV